MSQRQRRSSNVITDTQPNHSIENKSKERPSQFRQKLGIKGHNPPLIQRLLGANTSPNRLEGMKSRLVGRGLASKLITQSRNSRGGFDQNQRLKNPFQARKVDNSLAFFSNFWFGVANSLLNFVAMKIYY